MNPIIDNTSIDCKWLITLGIEFWNTYNAIYFADLKFCRMGWSDLILQYINDKDSTYYMLLKEVEIYCKALSYLNSIVWIVRRFKNEFDTDFSCYKEVRCNESSYWRFKKQSFISKRLSKDDIYINFAEIKFWKIEDIFFMLYKPNIERVLIYLRLQKN